MNTKSLSRRETVLKSLRAARRGKLTVAGKAVKTTGGWVDGAVLTNDEIGGTHGLRRLRELRATGTNIEKRYNTETGVFQYRIAK